MTAPRSDAPAAGTDPEPGPRATSGGELHPVRGGGLIDQVIGQLREQVVSGRWPVSGRIPTEPELARMTGTGRNTVREAVQALVHAGLLERRQGSGTYVLAASELAGAVSRRMAAARHRDVLEVRRTLEVGAARLAAMRRTASDADRLRELLVRRSATAATGDLEALVAADVSLHRAIAQAAHNPVLSDLYENVLDAVGENVRHNLVHTPPGGDDDHAELVTAILDGDPERAAGEAARFLDELLRGTSVPGC